VGPYTYNLIVSASYNGVVNNYISDSLNGVAGLAMSDFNNNPISIDVYINPLNPEEYYVDISDIPTLTPDRIIELIKKTTINR